MRVLVTGINGFVGSHAAEFFLGIPGVELHGTVLPGGELKNIGHITSRLHLHKADIVDAGLMEKIFLDVQPDKVIHLAGQAFVPTSMRDPVGTFQTNVMGGISVLDAARRQGEKTARHPDLLLVSTGEVYGRLPRYLITEDSALDPRNPYAVSKTCLDLICQTYRRSFDVNVTVVRPFNHAGPRQSPVFVASNFGRQFALIAAGKAEPVIIAGNLNPKRDFTDVRDVVRAYWAILTHPSEHTVFNVCSGQVFAIRDLVAMFEEVSGVKVTARSEQDRLREDDVPFVAGSYARLEAVTGWQPAIPLRQTLADVFAYWQAEVGAS